MNSYLSLIPISARVRRRQSKMILICIFLAVFMVTAIFSLAEAITGAEVNQSIDEKGYWHIWVKGIGEEDGQQIAERSDVAAVSWYDVLNLDDDFQMNKDYYIQGMQTALCGIDESFIADIMHYFSEGAQVNSENQVILTENAQRLLGVEIGDKITLNTPAGDYDFVISGFRITGNGKYVGSNGGETSALLVKENQIGAFMHIGVFRQICNANREETSPRYYIQFRKRANLAKAIGEIREQYEIGDDEVGLNSILMASKGISDRSYINGFYATALMLFVLILAAGVMMISSSMNSNVAQRMQFFGMLRCIGASKKQIMRFVRLEALNWCRTAVPIGVGLGVLATWIVCAGVKYLIGGEWEDISIFVVSPIGILCGVIIGVATVFLAAQAPAKRAAKASPVSAVSGSAGDIKNVKHAAPRLGKVETSLGIHHAVSSRRNLVLMTGSFAFSIILFLCFSVAIEFIECLVPQKASSPDLDIQSENATNNIEASLVEQIREIEGVAHVFGRSVCFGVSAQVPDKSAQREDGNYEFQERKIDLMSYDDYPLELLVKDKDLRKGSDIEKVFGDSGYALTIWDQDMPLEIGDHVRVGDVELEIAGMLKYNPFTNSGGSDGVITIISSEETFARMTGVTDYAVVDVQMKGKSGDERANAVEQIRKLADGHAFRDRGQEDTEKEFLVFVVFAYGFVIVIAFIALLNIVNSISMSVSARITQYGAMRAIGMSVRQITKMIAAEAFTYALFGGILGFGVGLPLSKRVYGFLITDHFYYFSWSVPWGQLAVVVLAILIGVGTAVWTPAKRIKNMEITETINEL